MGFLQAVRACWALFASFSCMALGHGLLGSLIGVRLTLEGHSSGTAGLVTAGFFVGIVLAALLAPRLIERVGHVRIFAAMAALAALAALAHSVWVDPWLWFLLRVVSGAASTTMYIVVESWVNARAQNEYRGLLLSVYMVVWLLSMAGGQLLLDVADPAGHLLFLLVTAGYILAILPLTLATSPAPDYASPKRVSLAVLWRVSPLAAIGAAGVGMIHGALIGLAAVYAKSAGFALSQVAWLTAAIFLGGLVLQLPIGRLSDRFERRLVLVGITLAAALVALAGLLLQDFVWLLAVMALLGGLALPLYPICLALANDRLSQQEMVGASATIYLLVGLGAAAGPPVAGFLMEALGPAQGFFAYLCALQASLGLYALWRRSRTPAPQAHGVAPPAAPILPPPPEAPQRGSTTV